MCGLIAEFNTRKKKQKNKDVNEFIINQYQDQHNRGDEGFGIIRIDDKFNVEIDRACETTKFLFDLYLKRSKMIIAHHRHPTSTDNKMDQTHPMSISEEEFKHDYEIIHNGIITNDKELREIHEKRKIFYRTEHEKISKSYYNNDKEEIETVWNDSEALAVELALFIEGKIKKIRTENSAAFIILQRNKKTGKAEKVFFGKNGSFAELNMEKKNGILKLSSEGPGKKITSNKLFSFKITDPQMKINKKDIIFEKIEIPIRTITPVKIENKKENPTESHHTPSESSTSNKYTNQIINKKIESPSDKEPLTRSWVKNLQDESINYDCLIDIVDKSYIATACATFATKIKNSDPTSVTHQIDEALDEQLDKMYEIIAVFKQIMIIDKMDKESLKYCQDEVKIIMNTMYHLTAMAEKRYEIAEEETDKEKFNTGFDLQSRKEENAINENAISSLYRGPVF